MGTTVFRGGRVFDGLGGPAREVDVMIEDTTIVAVGPDLTGDTTVDCDGLSLIPGLFDCHSHIAFHDDFNLMSILGTHYHEELLRFPARALQYLNMGITTVRDAGGASLGMKTAIDKGIIEGPRLQPSIVMLSSTGGHSDGYMPYGGTIGSDVETPGYPNPLCDGPEECGKKAREVIRAGADVIKICVTGGISTPGDDPHHATYSEEEIAAFVDTAADMGRPVMAHAHGTEGIKRAVRAGVRSIEHGTFLDEEGADLMVEHGTWLVATLTNSDSTDAWAADENQPQDVREKMLAVKEHEGKAFQLAVDKGVRIAMGTDCPVTPHGSNLRELQHMVNLGLDPIDALSAATISSAQLLGVADELGSLEAGKTADVVLVEGDPLEYATLGERIRQVWKAGTRTGADMARRHDD